MIESFDPVALAYGAKVCLALGGQPVSSGGAADPLAAPPWTAIPWIALPWWRRARLWIGPTPL